MGAGVSIVKSFNALFTLSFLGLLSGCATDFVSPPHEDYPDLKAAHMARARGDLPVAIHDYRNIIKENPCCQVRGNPACEAAYMGLGFSLLDANAVPEAKETFDKAITMFPNCAGPYTGLGMVFLVMDQPENALEAFRTALSLDPRCAKALNGYGIAQDMFGNHEAAQANYRAAMELDPLSISFESNLALSMALAGNEREAIRILERLSRSPNATARVRQNLSLAYGLAGDRAMAKKIGRVDLSDEMVANNIAYMEAIRETEDYVGIIPKDHTPPLEQGRKWQERY